MSPDTPYYIETLVWSALYTGCGIVFYGIAIWVIIRGGKDIIEILKQAQDNMHN